MVDLSQLHRQLTQMRAISKQVGTDLAKVEHSVDELQTKLRPVTEMNQTVGLCKVNITTSHDKIKATCEALQMAQEATKQMGLKDLIVEKPAVYAHWMKVGQQVLDQKNLTGYLHQDTVVGELKLAL